MTSVVGEFDHYVSNETVWRGGTQKDELYLTNGSKYFIMDPEYSVFKKYSFLKNVNKGQKVELLVDRQSKLKNITMIKAGKLVYLSFQDAYNADKQDNKWGIAFGYIIFLLSIIGFVWAIHVTSWRIKLDESNDNFIYKTAFGRTYTIFYHDISYYKTGKLALIFKYNGKFFVVNPYAENYRPFLHILIKKDVKKIFKSV
jgi:hypothetical protein